MIPDWYTSVYQVVTSTELSHMLLISVYTCIVLCTISLRLLTFLPTHSTSGGSNERMCGANHSLYALQADSGRQARSVFSTAVHPPVCVSVLFQLSPSLPPSPLPPSPPPPSPGVLFSGVSVVEASCTLLASVIYNSLYPVTRVVFPGLIFYLMAAALLIPLGLIL